MNTRIYNLIPVLGDAMILGKINRLVAARSRREVLLSA